MVIEIKDQLDEAHFGSCTTFTCKQIAFDFGVRVITIFSKKNLDTIWELIFFSMAKTTNQLFLSKSAYNHCSRCVTNVA